MREVGVLPKIEIVWKPEWKWGHIMVDGEHVGYALEKHREWWERAVTPLLVMDVDDA